MVTSNSIFAPAKVNLSLKIVGKREDNYHLLKSIVVFVNYGDELLFEDSDNLSLNIIGEFRDKLLKFPIENNLVIKSAKALQKYTKKPVGAKITLIKNLPIASGIGGGSANAAATIRALSDLWKINIDKSSLLKIALELGSDVPICYYRKACLMEGIGEKISFLQLKEKIYIVLITPDISVSTAEIFGNINKSMYGQFPDKQNYTDIIEPELLIDEKLYGNVLQQVTIAKFPIIGDIIESISKTTGCFLSRMSGSGATCFGLYKNKQNADNAALELKRKYSGSWCVSASIQE
ncbi:MAG: 4-(cytidine 5'-diphospho)-2-C-methyl-D-erythritol kinase [Rickettsiales bacterium]